MIEVTNNASLPFIVFVERTGSNTKGKKIYSYANSEEDAQELCDFKNKIEPKRAQFFYSVGINEALRSA